jgi:SAM-dependent methyltransferase
VTVSRREDEVVAHNREAWNREARAGEIWSRPVDAATIARARAGDFAVILTPTVPVPLDWFGGLADAAVLGLAAGGGQQMPVLAAAGSRVTSFDLSDEQLALDAAVAAREALPLRCVQGDMTRRLPFADETFDLVFHPVSNLFVPDPVPVWRECARVLRPGGVLLAGFMNPDWFVFDHDEAERSGEVRARYRLPYREPDDLRGQDLRDWQDEGRQICFSHSMDAQLGGQLAAGLRLEGFYEDGWDQAVTPVAAWVPSAFATRAVRLA